MPTNKKTIRAMAAALCSLAVLCGTVAQGTAAHAAEAGGSPYNITVGVGSSDSETRFCWISGSSAAGELQIAKTGDVKGGSFPANAAKQASTKLVTATEGVLDNPGNTDHPVSSFTDAGGAALTDEYSSQVTVGSLAPDTSYSYRVGDGTTWSPVYTFQTKSTAKGFSFAAFGDPQVGASGNLANDQAGWANTLNKVYSKFPNVNFLFSMGDQVNDYDHLYTQQQEYKAFFNPESSVNYLQTHLLAAYSGNHDFQMGRYYSFHYNQPNLSTLGQTQTNNVPDNNGDYWFRYGSTLFMVLEGNNFYDVSAHDAFMKQAISANQNAKWKIVSFHQAPYSEANHDGATSSDDDVMFMRNNWTKLMDKYAVDVVLNGHDHYYTRSFQMYGGSPVNTVKTNKVTNPKGTVYFTLDSGSGSKYYKYNTTADHSFSAFGWQNNVPTYTYVSVTDGAISLSTYATSSDTPIDTYTITKSAAAPAAASVKPAGTASNPKTGDRKGSDSAVFAIAAVALLAALLSAVMILRKKAARG
ncbi:metallophosphoesterase family protein [Caproiciproducens sp. NJN-50]|uniref:purple acid phosphatase family protein n=1 Tax=Caproiciproducens sp. NJN-50 TaxID=2507162 RepID=UPI000FFE260B|nr:metallophosphoesterase family protein [Caproiciproducens sp. NJN-50]QAT48635.1 metallophosphoesterase family protein [Caproiciproducens sp. NJN-50]